MSDSVQPTNLVALVAYMEKQARRYLSNLKKVLSEGETEAVHDVRVASRRLEEPLRIASAWLGVKPIEKSARLLKQTRRALRIVRDLDVLLASLCGATMPHGLDAKDLARLEGALTNLRERGIKKARRRFRRLDSTRAAGKVRKLSSAMQEVVEASDATLIGEQIDDLFRKSVERLKRRDPRVSEAADLHQTRIHLKRVRYSTELRRDVCGQDHPELHRALINMQDLLGYWNDQLAAIRVIARLARDEQALSDDAGWCARLLDHCAHRGREADAMRRRILDRWADFAAVLQSVDLAESPATDDSSSASVAAQPSA